MAVKVDTSFIPDLPEGPLSEYRKRVNFDWKHLKVLLEEEQSLRIKYKIWRILENDSLFKRDKKPTPSTSEQKRICALQMNHIIYKLKIISPDSKQKLFSERTKYLMSVNEALHAYSPSLSIKIALCVGLFNNALRAMGTERHMTYYDATWHHKVITCLAITEVSHGSNTKSIRTTATYDPQTQQFIINTPDFEAAKCWIGNLGKSAAIAMTFANLYTPDGVNQGLHGFLIPIRDPTTLQPYPGILVGDVGEKIGLHGIDNGFIMFTNYRIPRENLLNRNGDVTVDGVYESVFAEPSKALGSALECFSAGRIGIIQEAINTLSKAVVIAVRYAAIRKQFGPERDGSEISIIEYQLHQWRIFPYLAAACILKVVVNELTAQYLNVIERSQEDSNSFDVLIVAEIHAVISACKPMITWVARDALQEAREACGGHGCLKASALGDLRNDHDPSCTYEGDNNVLGQQTSNWLIRQYTTNIESPMGTVEFVKGSKELLQQTSLTVLERYPLGTIEFVISCYQWLICFLLQTTNDYMDKETSCGRNRFEARNNSQVYGGRLLVNVYAEYFCLKQFIKRIQQPHINREYFSILKLLFDVYSMWCLDRHMTNFYLGNFACNKDFANSIRSQLLVKCAELKNAAVSVADALAPPDFILNSVIARADGCLYENLKEEFLTNPEALQRPSWLRDISVIPSKAKL